MFTWVLNNLETITKLGAYIGGMWAAFRFLYTKAYKPSSAFITRMKGAISELENNGGGSMKDILQQTKDKVGKVQRDISVMKAAMDANFQLSPDCIFQCAPPDGRCIMVNESICRLYGADREQLLGYGWTNFIDDSVDEDAKETAKDYWKQAVISDNVINSQYTIINGFTGERIPCVYTAYVKRNGETNEIISIFGIVIKKNL